MRAAPVATEETPAGAGTGAGPVNALSARWEEQRQSGRDRWGCGLLSDVGATSLEWEKRVEAVEQEKTEQADDEDIEPKPRPKNIPTVVSPNAYKKRLEEEAARLAEARGREKEQAAKQQGGSLADPPGSQDDNSPRAPGTEGAGGDAGDGKGAGAAGGPSSTKGVVGDGAGDAGAGRPTEASRGAAEGGAEGQARAGGAVDAGGAEGSGTRPADEGAGGPRASDQRGGVSEGAVAPTADVDLRERINYASKSNGAKVLAYNPEVKNAGSLLSEDSNSYLLSPCSAPERWVMVELTQEVSLDTIVLEDHEMHSSRVKDFEVYGRQSRPTVRQSRGPLPDLSGWVLLGQFRAKNMHSRPQNFAVSGHAWVKFLLVRFLNHYGNEVNCCLSSLKAYGVGEYENLQQELDLAEREMEDLRSAFSGERKEETPKTPEAPAQQPPEPVTAPHVRSESTPPVPPPADTVPIDPNAAATDAQLLGAAGDAPSAADGDQTPSAPSEGQQRREGAPDGDGKSGTQQVGAERVDVKAAEGTSRQTGTDGGDGADGGRGGEEYTRPADPAVSEGADVAAEKSRGGDGASARAQGVPDGGRADEDADDAGKQSAAQPEAAKRQEGAEEAAAPPPRQGNATRVTGSAPGDAGAAARGNATADAAAEQGAVQASERNRTAADGAMTGGGARADEVARAASAAARTAGDAAKGKAENRTEAAAGSATAGSAQLGSPGGAPTSENVYIKLVKKVKDLERSQLVFERLIVELTANYTELFQDLYSDLEGNVEAMRKLQRKANGISEAVNVTRRKAEADVALLTQELAQIRSMLVAQQASSRVSTVVAILLAFACVALAWPRLRKRSAPGDSRFAPHDVSNGGAAADAPGIVGDNVPSPKSPRSPRKLVPALLIGAAGLSVSAAVFETATVRAAWHALAGFPAVPGP
ncbi:unnamed protein product [Pedinophyceae sp. YPF-701]|nr:unnamed protein product [Pedinophyceae sp. YPF-701]